MRPALRCTYSDESYNAREWWAVGVLLPHDAAAAAREALDHVVARAARTWAHVGLPPDIELHGHWLLQGGGPYRPLPVKARIAIYRDALATLATANPTIFLRGVDRQRLDARYARPLHPHQVAMTFLLESVDEHLCDVGTGQCTTLVADENDETRALLTQDLAHFQARATWGFKGRQITRVLDTIQFTPSAGDRLVQAADLVAYMNLRRRSRPRETDARAEKASHLLWETISPHVRTRLFWRP